MGSRRQNTTERRLAQVRKIKDRYFADELTVEESLEAKDARIALLEGQVNELQRRMDALERAHASNDATNAERRAQPEPDPPTERENAAVPSVAGEPELPGFDFYRD